MSLATFVLFKSIHQNAHTVVPELNTAIVKSSREKWLSWMKRESCERISQIKLEGFDCRPTLDAITLGLEFCEHYRHVGRNFGACERDISIDFREL